MILRFLNTRQFYHSTKDNTRQISGSTDKNTRQSKGFALASGFHHIHTYKCKTLHLSVSSPFRQSSTVARLGAPYILYPRDCVKTSTPCKQEGGHGKN